MSLVWMLPCTSVSGWVPAHDTGLLETTEEDDSRVLSCSLESCLFTRAELVLSEASDSSHLFLSALVGVANGDLMSALVGVAGVKGVLCLVSSREHNAVVFDLK